jgi:hypothetical protein
MNTVLSTSVLETDVTETYIQAYVDAEIENLLSSLPVPAHLDAEQRRGIISRYTAVLEGNFIYWMTGAYLAVGTKLARSIILDNLLEEVRDSHPLMLRKFAVAASSAPTESDALAIQAELTNVRLFVGRLSGIPILITMAFFEGFIQKFMSYLAELAAGQGSQEREYTDVHGVCDIAHTEGLIRALAEEMAAVPSGSVKDLFEGVDLLGTLIRRIVGPSGTNTTAPLIS